MKLFRVKGMCLVPTEVEMELYADSAHDAVHVAKQLDWKSLIDTNSADTRAAFDWEPSAEEIPFQSKP